MLLRCSLLGTFLWGATAAARANDVVQDTFENGVNLGSWSFNVLTPDVLEQSGGNPGGWLHNSLVISFAPIATASGGAFTGDYRARGVAQLSVDARTDLASLGAGGRQFSLLLRDTQGTPGVDDDDYAYFVGPLVPQPGQGWVHFDFPVPSASVEPVPAGWRGGWVGNLTQFRPGIDWNDVIVSVDQVELWWLHPAKVALLQDWDIGLDNVTLTMQPPAGTLALAAAPGSVAAGGTLQLTTCGGFPGAPVLVAGVDVNGIPTFLKLFLQTFDAAGAATQSVIVPPGLGGIVLTMQSFGFVDATTLVASNPAEVTFL